MLWICIEVLLQPPATRVLPSNTREPGRGREVHLVLQLPEARHEVPRAGQDAHRGPGLGLFEPAAEMLTFDRGEQRLDEVPHHHVFALVRRELQGETNKVGKHPVHIEDCYMLAAHLYLSISRAAW